jgi:hypothetical protein
MDCSEHSPARIKPHLGQISKNSSKPASSEHWGVLHEHVARSHFANDAGHFAPESAAGPADAGPFAGGTDVLTGKPAGDDIDFSSPRLSVECSDIIPDWEPWQASVPLSGEQDSPGVLINLNSADGAPSKELAAQDASSCPCKKCQLIQWVPFLFSCVPD